MRRRILKLRKFDDSILFPLGFFHGRKSFKKTAPPLHRSRAQPVVLCPQCRAPLHWMGRKFAAPRQSDIGGWNKVRDWLRLRKQQQIENGTWQQRAAACLVIFKKERAKRQRKIARAVWLKTTRRKRDLKNLQEWTRQQDENLAP